MSDHDLDLLRDICDEINAGIDRQPRSLQRLVGPSEVGGCERKLALKMLGTERCNDNLEGQTWKSFIGTCVHAGLDDIFTGSHRWLPSVKVKIGTYGPNAVPLIGTCDLVRLDPTPITVIDFKVTAAKYAKAYAEQTPQSYLWQTHLYAWGLRNIGIKVEQVAIVYLPRDRQLTSAFVWMDRYDPAIAIEAMGRLDQLATDIDAHGEEAVSLTERTEDYCDMCPFYKPGVSPASVDSCPGVANRHGKVSDLAELIA